MFECLVGYPPFCSETTHETYKKIIDWQKHLSFPKDVHLSREAEDLIRRLAFFVLFYESRLTDTALSGIRLITSQDLRLNVEQIKAHPFFYGVDWESIRNIDAPFVPHLRSITDTSYFPTDELEAVPDQPVGADVDGSNKDLAFLGYFDYYHLKVKSDADLFFLDIPSRDSPSLPPHFNIHFSFSMRVCVISKHSAGLCVRSMHHREQDIPYCRKAVSSILHKGREHHQSAHYGAFFIHHIRYPVTPT